MIRRNLFLSLSLASVILFSSCKDDSQPEEIIEESIEFTKEGELSLIKAGGDTIKKLDIEIADSQYEHETGLMYRESMEELQGMLFIYDDAAPRAFYMKNTYIPLDIIYYSSDSTAVSFYENTEPMDQTSLPSGEPTQFVLEINAGLIEKWGIEVGDKIYFKRTD
ncbi:MAG TPA: DUF192 domain-containing protein [Salegentibacter sp.]|uniref:DUF192 domain-containing protein n=1 Tax=Salegentibacter sp. TaxID=1903072 RepID=UPI002F93BCC2